MNQGSVYNMDNDPWNRKKQDSPPGLEDIFKDIFGDGKKKGNEKQANLFVPLFVISLILFAASGFFIVGPAEKAVVTRFGKINRIAGPGPNWAFPLAEHYNIVDIQKIGAYNYSAEMLTSDESYADVDVTVFYRIENPVDFLYNVVDPVNSLGQATASALRQVVGNTPLEQILTDGRAKARDQIQTQIESVVDFYKLGLEVTDTKLQDAKPPQAVKAAFDDVIQAREDYDRFILDAEGYSNSVIPKADGERMRILNRAKGEYEQVVMDASAQVAGFEAIIPEYNKHPDIIRNQIFVSTMKDIYGKARKVFLSNDGSVNLLPLGEIINQNIEGSHGQ